MCVGFTEFMADLQKLVLKAQQFDSFPGSSFLELSTAVSDFLDFSTLVKTWRRKAL